MSLRFGPAALVSLLLAGVLAPLARTQPPPPPPAQQEAQRSALTPESPATIRIEEDEDETFNVVFTVDPPLRDGITVDQDGSGAQNAITARLTDLRSAEGDLFSTARVDDVKISGGRTQLEVAVDADPAGDLEGADYTGNVVVSGSGITPGRSAVTLKLVETPFGTEAERYLVAAAALLAGVIMGALLTWLNSQGSKLVAAQRRLAGIDARLRPLEGWLPAALTNRLGVVRQALVDYDQKLATEELDRITADQIDTLVALLTRLSSLSEKLTAAEGRLASRPDLPEPARQAVLQAVAAGQSGLRDRAQRSWSPSDVVEDDPVLRGAMVALLELVEYWATKELWHDAATEAARLFARQRWAEAESAVNALEAPAPGAGAEAFTAGPGEAHYGWLAGDLAPAGVRRWRPGLRLFVLKRFNFVAGTLVALGVVLVGLTGVFDPDTTFNDFFEDLLKLVGWGFGTQTVGVTFAQLGNTLIGDRLKLAG